MPISLLWLIDDDEQDRALSRQILAEHAPHITLVTYSSATEAITALQHPDTTLPQLILLDLQMPLITGLELLDLLKADPFCRQIPIVILSASDDPQQIQQAYVKYASSYVNKAKTFEDFERQMVALLDFWRVASLPPVWYDERKPLI